MISTAYIAARALGYDIYKLYRKERTFGARTNRLLNRFPLLNDNSYYA